MANSYVTFRIRLARHGLRQFFASLKNSATILLLVAGHAFIGLLAMSAFPPMYAASLAPPLSLALLAGHALVMTLPLVLLRKRILPIDVVHWMHRLPISPRLQLCADGAVAALMVVPLALLYAVSAAVLLHYGGQWLHPVPAIGATVVSLLITLTCSTAVLSLRARRVKPRWSWWSQAAHEEGRYMPRRPRMRLMMLWHRLFWLPFWRADNAVGRQQCLLLAAAIGSAVPWMQAPPGIARGLLALATSALMVLLTDRGDKAVREQTALLRPVLASWPLFPRGLFACARLLSAAPALLVLLVVAAGGAQHGLWQHTAGQVFLVLGCAAPLLLVATSAANEGFRVGLVAVEIMLLTAIGSELWK